MNDFCRGVYAEREPVAYAVVDDEFGTDLPILIQAGPISETEWSCTDVFGEHDLAAVGVACED